MTTGALPTVVPLLLTLLTACPVFAQGTLKGCVADANWGVLPGVDIVASKGTVQERRVTDSSGCYEFAKLPAGTYTVVASLTGFVTTEREVRVVDGRSAVLDFAMCVTGTLEIDWPVPAGGLREMFRAADLVAYVRIRDTRAVTKDCLSAGFLHTVDVIELLKDRLIRPVPDKLAFVQERWLQEQAPYPIGQSMVIFLTARRNDRFARAFGPFGVFFIDGDKVTSWHSHVKTDKTDPSEFLLLLRGFAREDRKK